MGFPYSNAADFFSGAGIMSYGFKETGFSITNGFEIDAARCKIFEKNLLVNAEPVDLIQVGIESLKFDLAGDSNKVEVVTGCPPCQSFSSLHRTRGIPTNEDGRTQLIEKYGQLAVELSPNVIIFENVRGILTSQNRPYFERYLSILEPEYKTRWELIDAADYGIPQHRKRVVAISIKKELNVEPSLPKRTHSRDGHEGTKKWKTVKNAIANLKPLESGESDPNDFMHGAPLHSERTLEIIRAIPKNGGSRKSLPEDLILPCHRKLAKQKGAESVYGRMKWSDPSPTITGASIRPSSGRFIHPDQDRGITLREMARLQTIPDSYKFEGSKDAIASMIGDAVPFELAKVIANHVKRLLREAGVA